MSRFPRLGRTTLVVQAVAALLFAGWLLAQQDPRLPWDGSYDIEVELAGASGLRTGSRALVTVAGVPSGKVDEVRYADGRAIARVRLDGDTEGRVHRGAIATVQPRSALADLVLDLTAGDLHAPALRDGDRLTARDTRRAVAADEVLSALDVDARAALQVVLGQLDVAAGGDRGGRLGAAVRALDPFSASARDVARQLAGRRTDLTRLVGAMDRLTGALARQAAPLERALAAGRRTTDVLARRDAELDATVRALPATLREVRATMDAVGALGARLDPALDALRPAARRLPAALGALQDATPDARSLVRELRATADDGATATRSLRTSLERLGPVARALEPTAGRVAPVVDAIDRYRDGIGELGARFSGIFSTSDANGVVLRGLGFFEPFDPANFGFPGATGARRAKVAADAARALTRLCDRDRPLACLVRYLVPGLPGAVRTAADPLGTTKRLTARPAKEARP